MVIKEENCYEYSDLSLIKATPVVLNSKQMIALAPLNPVAPASPSSNNGTYRKKQQQKTNKKLLRKERISNRKNMFCGIPIMLKREDLKDITCTGDRYKQKD